MPNPKERWWFGRRVRSSRSGSAKWSGSRLADEYMRTSCEPAATGCPPTVVSTVATRHMLWIGVTKRMSSSVAQARSIPSRSNAHWSGRADSSTSERAITVLVVSAPPSSSRSESAMTASIGSSAPSTAAVAHTVMRSSAGHPRFAAWRSAAAWANSMAATIPSSFR